MATISVESGKLQQAIEGVRIQQANRRSWQESDTPEAVANMILEETQELIEGIQESFVTGDVFTVASEIADVLYLSFRLCEQLGLDPADLLKMKTERNSRKYPDSIMNNGYQPAEAARVAKESWKIMGGDIAFSHAYLDVLAEDAE